MCARSDQECSLKDEGIGKSRGRASARKQEKKEEQPSRQREAQRSSAILLRENILIKNPTEEFVDEKDKGGSEKGRR